MKWIEIDISEGIVRVDDITEGDLNSAGIRVVNFPENWKDKLVNAVFYRGTDSIDVRLKLNDDKDRLIGEVPTQMLAEDGSFKIVVYAVAKNQVEEPYRDVRPAVWAEVRDGLESAEILPMDKDVGAYLTLLIDLQNKEVSIDEMIERLGDIEAIKSKLEGVADGAEVNVQADWSEEDASSDAYVKNKPTIDQSLDGGSTNAVANYIVTNEFSAIGGAVTNLSGQADANKEAFELHRANGDDGVKHLTDSEKADVGKIGKIESDIGEIDNIYSDKKNLVDAHNELWEQVDSDRSRISANELKCAQAETHITDILSGGAPVAYALEAGKALTDGFGNIIDETYATKEALYPTPITTVPNVLEPNKSYNFGTVEELSLDFPSNANDGDVIYITFKSDAVNPTNLVVNTLNLHDEFELIPESGEGYEMYAKYIDGGWLVKYSSYTPASFTHLPVPEEN